MLQFIKKTSFKNVVTLMSGTVLAQAFTLAIYPVLTQLYSPAQFGVYGLFSAILSGLAALANGGYNNTIMLPKERHSAYHLLVLCGIFVVSVSTVSAIFILVFQEVFERLIDYKGNKFWLFLLPVSLLLEGFYFSFSAILNREGKYQALTRSKILQALFTGVVSLVIGYWFSDLSDGLIYGLICGQIASFVTMLIYIIRFFPIDDIAWHQVKQIAKDYKDFPRYGLASGYLNTLSRQIPFYILPVFFGTEVLGYFTLAYKILTAPVTFIGSSISMIYYQKAARAKDEGAAQMKKLNYKLSLLFGVVSIFPVLIIIVFGPDIFDFVFGHEFRKAGEYARWIIAWVAMMYILNPLSFLIDIYGRLKFQLVYNILFFISRVAISILGGIYFNAEATIAAFGVAAFLFSFTLFVWLLKISPSDQP